MNLNKILKSKTFIPSDKILQKNFEGIEAQGLQVFTKKDNLLDSELFGVPLKYLGIIAFIIYVVKNK